MKKKTYKQMQNRLYREIKRRIEAENRIKIPLEVNVCERKIDTIELRKCIDRRELAMYLGDEGGEMIKRSMAHEVCNTLYDEGYFVFYNSTSPSDVVFDYKELECRIDIVRPVL